MFALHRELQAYHLHDIRRALAAIPLAHPGVAALLTALIVMTMTWGVMPRLTRWMRGFLNPHAKK